MHVHFQLSFLQQKYPFPMIPMTTTNLHLPPPVYICYYIDLHKFSIRTKSWNCYAQIHLFPTLYDLHFKSASKIIKTSHPAYYSYSMSPSIPSLHSMVQLQEHTKYNAAARNELAKWMYKFAYGHRHILSWSSLLPPPGIMLIFQAFPIAASSQIENILHGRKSMIELAQIHKLDPVRSLRTNSGKNQDGRFPPMLGFLQTLKNVKELSNFTLLRSLAFTRPSEHVIWDVSGRSTGQTLSHFVLHFLNLCGQRVGRAFVGVWKSIIRNYTLINAKPGKYYCVSGKLASHRPYESLESNSIRMALVPHLQWSYYSPYYIKSDFTALRFVSCGQRPLMSLPFQELVNVFDNWIWLCICFLTAAVVLSLPLLTCQKSIAPITSYWLGPVKVLL